jgi:hypothetical protein
MAAGEGFHIFILRGRWGMRGGCLLETQINIPHFHMRTCNVWASMDWKDGGGDIFEIGEVK